VKKVTSDGFWSQARAGGLPLGRQLPPSVG
jgi:hypothetical protein